MNRRKSKAIRKSAIQLASERGLKSYKNLNRFLKREYNKLPWNQRGEAVEN